MKKIPCPTSGRRLVLAILAVFTLFVSMAAAMASVAIFYQLARRHIRPPHPSLTPSREEPAETVDRVEEAIES